MFRVRTAQLVALGVPTRAKFVKKMAAYVRGAYPEAVEAMTAEELEAWVRAVVEKAERYAITTEPEVAQFVLLLLLLGEHADDQRSWVREELVRVGRSPMGRLRALVARARAHGVEHVDAVVIAEVIDGDMESP